MINQERTTLNNDVSVVELTTAAAAAVTSVASQEKTTPKLEMKANTTPLVAVPAGVRACECAL